MAYPQKDSALHKSLLTSVRPSDCLHITTELQQELADQPWLPGMSVFSVNGLPQDVAQSNAQREDLQPSSPMPMSFPPRPCPINSNPRIPASYHLCPEASEIGLHRNAHEENNRVAIESTSKSQGCSSPHGCISPAAVIDHMRKSGASDDSIRSVYSNPALLDYNCQLMLLEHQNRKRITMAQASPPAVDEQIRPCGSFRSSRHCGSALHDYNTQLMLLEQQNKKRLAMAREEQEKLTPNIIEQRIKPEMSPEVKFAYERAELDHKNPKAMDERKRETPAHLALPSLPALHMPAFQDTHSCAYENSPPSLDDQDPGSQIGPSHQLWLSGPHALQDYETQRRLIEQQKNAQNPASRNLALQDYQMQLMLLEAQNKKRKGMQDAAKAKEDEQLAAQRQAIIQRHQLNMKHWQSTQQQHAMKKVVNGLNTHTPSEPSRRFHPRPAQTAAHAGQDRQFAAQAPASPPSHLDISSTALYQSCTATCDLSNSTGQPKKSGNPGERFVMDLPIRPSKKAVEQTDPDPDMEEWAEVERPRKRACSEESEQFSEGYDLIDLSSEC